MIADYEALEHKKFYFWKTPNEPKYIHYVGHSDNFDQWKEKSKNRRGCIFKRYEKKTDFIQYDFDDNDLDNEEGSLWYFEKKKENKSVDNDNEKEKEKGNKSVDDDNKKEKEKENKSVDNDNGNSNIDTNDKDEDRVNKLIGSIESLESEVAGLKDLVRKLTQK